MADVKQEPLTIEQIKSALGTSDTRRAAVRSAKEANDPEPTEARTTEREDAANAEAAEKQEAEAEAAKPDKKEKRFSKITKERDDARREKAELLARLEALEKGTAKPAKAEPPAPVNPKPVKPDFKDYEGKTFAEYDTAMDNYQEALADWKYEQKRDAERKTEAQQKAQTRWEEKNKAWQKQLDALREDEDDLEDAIETVGAKILRKGIIDVVKNSEFGAKIALYLHRNPKELDKLDDMDVADAARYIGRIEAIVEGESVGEKPTTEKSLPKPARVLGGAPSGNVKKAEINKMAPEDLKAYMREQGMLRR